MKLLKTFRLPKSLQEHLFLALLFGFLARLCSLWFVWGPQALDDYLDNLIPAWRHLEGLEPDLHKYRSPLYMWILSFWLRLGKFIYVENAIAQIRWVYFFQTLFSMLAIYAVYLIVKKANHYKFAIVAIWLASLHGILPFASTRSFMESIAIGLVTISIALLYLFREKGNEKYKFYYIFLGFVILGLTSLLRFQVGIIYVAWMGYLFFTKQIKSFSIGFIFGLCLIGLEALIDVQYGRYAFQTLHDYFAFNKDQKEAGIMPWYNTTLSLLGFMYFPFSFLLYKGWLQAIKKYWQLFLIVFLYVLVHSLNPHKEERYLYPILTLSFIFWAYAWVQSNQIKWIKYSYGILFFVLNTSFLIIGSFINTQVGLVKPFAEMQSISNQVLYLDYDSTSMRNAMLDFFVRKPAQHMQMKNAPEAKEIEHYFNGHPDLKYLMVVSQKYPQQLKISLNDLSKKYKCTDILQANSFSDDLMVKLAPHKNQRRLPTFYLSCQRS